MIITQYDTVVKRR